MKPACQCFSMISRKALTAATPNQCFWVLCQFPLTSRQWKWRIIVNILTVRQIKLEDFDDTSFGFLHGEILPGF